MKKIMSTLIIVFCSYLIVTMTSVTSTAAVPLKSGNVIISKNNNNTYGKKFSTTYFYDYGHKITPAVTVKYNKKILKKNKDYTLSYSNNIKAGKGYCIVKGKGKYKGTVKKGFKIKKLYIASDCNICLYPKAVKYSTSGKKRIYKFSLSKKPRMYLSVQECGSYNGQIHTKCFKKKEPHILKKNKDYKVSYKLKNKKMIITIKGIGSFSGTYTIIYRPDYMYTANKSLKIISRISYNPSVVKIIKGCNNYTYMQIMQPRSKRITGKALELGGSW